MPRQSQDGLEWEETTFGLVPQWTRDPSIAAIESVCRQQLAIPPGEPCTVTFHASGAFNKLYIITCPRGHLIMRVSLPVYPRHKTRAEVVTLRWVRENTRVPVPKVFGFDNTSDNEVGFEWILMELMQGTSADKLWRSMSMEQKVALTKRIATFQVELSGRGKIGPIFRSIGTLDLREADQNGNAQEADQNDDAQEGDHKADAKKGGQKDEAEEVGPEDDAGEVAQKDDAEEAAQKDDAEEADKKNHAEEAAKFVPSMLVAHEFFMGDHIHYDVPRGPFCSSHDWLSAQLDIILLHQNAVLEKTEDEDDIEDAEEILVAAQKLLALLPNVFPLTVDDPETTGLYHDDLHLNNILVDEEGEITAILDWECVSALPLWALTMGTKFLDGPVREEEPQRDSYADETPEESAESAAAAKVRGDPDPLDNEGKCDLYWINMMEYEATQLRKVHEARMRELWPEWPLEESRVKVNFFQAITQCDGIWVGKARRWACAIEKGEIVRFRDA